MLVAYTVVGMRLAQRSMPAFTRGLFDETTAPALPAFVDAFESWLAAREQFGSIRQASSVAVYRSMWSALSSWCVSRGLHLDDLRRG